MKIFSIYDSKAEAYNTPFFSPTVATALRSCEEAVADTSSEFAKYAEDYTLFELGSWDQHQGELLTLEAPRSLITFHEFKPTVASTLKEVTA